MNILLINLGLQSFIAPPIRKMAEQKAHNSTEKADSRYIKALKIKPMSVKEISDATGLGVCTVQRHVRVMEKRGQVEISCKERNGANPRIIWRLK